MSNVIGFLENAGCNAALRHASREQLLKAMESDQIGPEWRAAMLQPDRATIDGLLGVRGTMYAANKPVKAPPKKKPAKAPAKKAPKKKPAK